MNTFVKIEVNIFWKLHCTDKCAWSVEIYEYMFIYFTIKYVFLYFFHPLGVQYFGADQVTTLMIMLPKTDGKKKNNFDKILLFLQPVHIITLWTFKGRMDYFLFTFIIPVSSTIFWLWWYRHTSLCGTTHICGMNESFFLSFLL